MVMIMIDNIHSDHNDSIIEHDDNNDNNDYDYDDGGFSAPYCSIWEEMPCHVIFSLDLKEGFAADEVVILIEDPFLGVFFFTVHLVPPVFTLQKVVAVELLPQADLLPRPSLPVQTRSSLAHLTALAHLHFFLVQALSRFPSCLVLSLQS